MDYVVRVTHLETGGIVEQCRPARIPSIAREGLVRMILSGSQRDWYEGWNRKNIESVVRLCTSKICGYHK